MVENYLMESSTKVRSCVLGFIDAVKSSEANPLDYLFKQKVQNARYLAISSNFRFVIQILFHKKYLPIIQQRSGHCHQTNYICNRYKLIAPILKFGCVLRYISESLEKNEDDSQAKVSLFQFNNISYLIPIWVICIWSCGWCEKSKHCI